MADLPKDTSKPWTKQEASQKLLKEGVSFIYKDKDTAIGVYLGHAHTCYACNDEKAKERVRFYYAEGLTTLDWATTAEFVDDVLLAWQTAVPLVKLNGQTYFISGRLLWAVMQAERVAPTVSKTAM